MRSLVASFSLLLLSPALVSVGGTSGMPKEMFDRLQDQMFDAQLASRLEEKHQQFMASAFVFVIDPNCACACEMTIRADGSLRGCRVIKTSGSSYFDDVAIQALRSVFPISEIPKSIFDQSGEATLRFTFCVRYQKRANQTPEPTTLLVMSRAGARATPSRVVAHL